MNKTLGLLLALLLLLGGIYYYINHTGRKTIDTFDREFAIENIEDIHKLFIASRTTDPVILVKSGEDWFVDDSLKANTRTVNTTLDALKKLEIAYIPTKEAYEPIMKEIAALGIKIEVYDKGDNLMRSFYIGGTSPDGRATQMIMEGAEKPYMMKVSGFEGGIKPRFYKVKDGWRDHYIFENLYERIDTLQIIYPRQKNESFVLTRAGEDEWNIAPYFSTTKKLDEKLNHTVVQKYLYKVTNTAIEGFKNDQREQFDETKEQIPFAQVYMSYRDGDSDEYQFFPLIDSKREADFKGNLFRDRERAMERLRIISKNGDYMIGQFHLMNRLFWGYSFFYE